MEGWIRIHRKMEKWERYQDSKMVHLFLHLLLSANHQDGKWKGIEVKRGQLITGRSSLKKATGISEQSLRTCLERLKSTSEITIKSTSKFSIITVVKYNDYNDIENQINQQNNHQINQQLTTNNNDKNILSNDNTISSVVEEKKKPREDITQVVEVIKKNIVSAGLFYDSKDDRIFGKHLLSKKFKEEKINVLANKIGQEIDIYRFIDIVFEIAFKDQFWKNKITSVPLFYNNASKVLNSYKQ